MCSVRSWRVPPHATKPKATGWRRLTARPRHSWLIASPSNRNGHNVSALRKLARAYAARGRKRLALRYLQKALALRPGQPSLLRDRLAGHAGDARSARVDVANAVGEDVPTGIFMVDDVVYAALEADRSGAPGR